MSLSRRGLLAAAVACPVCARAAAPRLLSLGGAVTEIVYALGRGGDLVGADLTSTYPPAAATLPRVGYVRALGAEGMLSLAPTLVLASTDAGPPAAMDGVRAAAVPVMTFPEAHAPAAALDRIRLVGAAVGQAGSAAAMAGVIGGDLDQVAADAGRVPGRRRVLFLLSTGRGAPMASGAGTAAAAMLALAGAVNAVSGYTGYRPLSAEAAVLAAPDAVLTTTDTLAGAGDAAGLRAGLPGIDPAVPVVALDGLFLLGFGPRLAQAVRALGAALHGEAAFRPLPDRPWAA